MPTRIAWTQETWNPVTGCTKVSPGCDNCYAERLMHRRGQDFCQVVLQPQRLQQPLHWKKARMIFVCSMSDMFHRRVLFEYVDQLFDVMRQTPQHTYQLLTKRPGRMAFFASQVLQGGWPPNVWAGTSVESAKYLPRLDVLARVPAPVRFVSLEPLLGPVDVSRWLYRWPLARSHTAEQILTPEPRTLDWVIVGGESGLNARPMKIEWVENVARQCAEARVPLFVKQDSGPRPGQQGRLSDSLWEMKQMPERR